MNHNNLFGDFRRAEQAPPPLLTFTWLFLLLPLGAYLRVPLDTSYLYNMDEATIVNVASCGSLSEVLHCSLFELNPPLFYILLHYWMMLSRDPNFVRCLPLLLGLLLIPVYYLIGRRLGGGWCGLACATLVALSHGCIFQSYVPRTYCLSVLNLSVAFYGYLCWRESYRRTLLAGYVLFGWLAFLSHFSAIFCLFSLGLFESCALLWRKAPGRALAEWLLANLAIAAVFLFAYRFWQPAILAYKYYFIANEPYPVTREALTAAMLSAPFMASSYLFPHFPLLLVLIGYACVPGSFPRRTALYPYLALTGVGCLVSMALYILRFYGALGGRQSLWMTPLLLPAASVMLVDSFERILASGRRSYLTAFALLVAMTLLYDIHERRQNRTELVEWTPSQQIAITRFIESFGPRDLIDAVRIGVVLFTNPYPYMNYDVSAGPEMAAVMPYHETRFLFNPYYSNDFSAGLMLATLEDAQSQHMLEGIDRLVLMSPGWRSPVIDLSLCPALEKEIVAFPPLPGGAVPTRLNLTSRVVFLLISKEAVLKDILPPGGRARACLNEKYDRVPGAARPLAAGTL